MRPPSITKPIIRKPLKTLSRLLTRNTSALYYAGENDEMQMMLEKVTLSFAYSYY